MSLSQEAPREPLCWSPWAAKYPFCQQMTTQTHPRGDKVVSEKIDFYCLWQVHLTENLPQAMNLQMATFGTTYHAHPYHGCPWLYK